MYFLALNWYQMYQSYGKQRGAAWVNWCQQDRSCAHQRRSSSVQLVHSFSLVTKLCCIPSCLVSEFNSLGITSPSPTIDACPLTHQCYQQSALGVNIKALAPPSVASSAHWARAKAGAFVEKVIYLDVMISSCFSVGVCFFSLYFSWDYTQGSRTRMPDSIHVTVSSGWGYCCGWYFLREKFWDVVSSTCLSVRVVSLSLHLLAVSARHWSLFFPWQGQRPVRGQM